MKNNAIVIFVLFLFSVGKITAQAPAHKPGHDTVKAMKESPLQMARMNYNKGLDDFAKKDYSTALVGFNSAISGDPKFEAA